MKLDNSLEGFVKLHQLCRVKPGESLSLSLSFCQSVSIRLYNSKDSRTLVRRSARSSPHLGGHQLQSHISHLAELHAVTRPKRKKHGPRWFTLVVGRRSSTNSLVQFVAGPPCHLPLCKVGWLVALLYLGASTESSTSSSTNSRSGSMGSSLGVHGIPNPPRSIDPPRAWRGASWALTCGGVRVNRRRDWGVGCRGC